jgi:branched-chain amino acid transport system substrate-binding protein
MENTRPQTLLTLLIACFLVLSALFGALVATHLNDHNVRVALLGGTGGRSVALDQGVAQGDDLSGSGDSVTGGTPPEVAAGAPARGARTGTGAPAPAANPAAVGGATTGITQGSIKLGATIDISGPVALPDVEKSVSAWFRHVNDTGGINGRRVEWIAYDDQLDANKGAANLQRLFEQDQVLAAVGNMSPFGVPKAIPYLEAHRYPVISGSGADESEFRSSMVWNPLANLERQVTGSCDLQRRAFPDKRKVGIVYIDTAITAAVNRYMTQCLQQHGYTDIQSFQVSLAQPDYTGTVLQLMAAQRDAIFPAVENKSQIRLLQAMDRQQYYPAVNGAVAGNDPAVRDYVGRAAEGMAISSHFRGLQDTHPSMQQMKAIVNQYFPGEFDQMTYWAEQAFVGAVMFTDVARQLGPALNRESLIAALNALHGYTPLGGLSPPITYGDPNAHSSTPGCYTYWYKRGTTFAAPSSFICP